MFYIIALILCAVMLIAAFKDSFVGVIIPAFALALCWLYFLSVDNTNNKEIDPDDRISVTFGQLSRVCDVNGGVEKQDFKFELMGTDTVTYTCKNGRVYEFGRLR